MLSKTHIASGLTVGLVVLSSNQLSLNNSEFISGIIFGSISPDIDTPKSWISQTVPYIDSLLRETNILKHRGLTHGITGIIFAIALWFFVRNDFTLGFGIGYCMHCISDSTMKVLKIEVKPKNDNFLYHLFWITNLVLIAYMIVKR